MQQSRTINCDYLETTSNLNQKECRELQERLQYSSGEEYNSLFELLYQSFSALSVGMY